MRIRLAGIIPMGDGFAFMHRVGVKNHPIGDYYTFPGGGKEGEETLEEGTIREIKEEFGIDKLIVVRFEGTNKDKGLEILSSIPNVVYADGLIQGVDALVERREQL